MYRKSFIDLPASASLHLDGGGGAESILLSGAGTGASINIAGGSGTDLFTYSMVGSQIVTYAGGAGGDSLDVAKGTFRLSADAQATSTDLRIYVRNLAVLSISA